MFIHIISVSLHAFLSSNYRVCIFEFCVLLHFYLDLVFAECSEVMPLCHSYAGLRGNNMIRGAVKGKVKVKTTELSRFFGASIVSLRPVMLQMWGPLRVRNI